MEDLIGGPIKYLVRMILHVELSVPNFTKQPTDFPLGQISHVRGRNPQPQCFSGAFTVCFQLVLIQACEIIPMKNCVVSFPTNALNNQGSFFFMVIIVNKNRDIFSMAKTHPCSHGKKETSTSQNVSPKKDVGRCFQF